ncbi:hypothetical protein [Anaeromyxobacter dehalogenans]|uniref:hypothetical protein n=1 Tax=Anaeromyxobacter dehalogenans TaxID=161493 RepID=UPI00059C262D|nr:hypothetical protein [Anaeromyxobacter dehalogenans]
MLLAVFVISGCVEGGPFLVPATSGGAGSGQLRWSKEGGTQSAFLQDRYACLRESQQNRSIAVVTQYGGSGSSGQVTDGGLFVACMSARGYALDANGQFAPPPGTEIYVR